MRELLLSASLAGLLLMGVSIPAHTASAQSASPQQSQKETKMVTGKISSIGTGGTSFALDVGAGDSKQTMQFVLDKSAKVQGDVRIGTAVTVEYAEEQGQNRALSVVAQG